MSKKNIYIVAIISLFLLVTIFVASNQPLNNSSNSTPANSDKIMQTNTDNFETLATVQDLKKRLEMKNSEDVLLDVRTADEFNKGHIKGAINIDFQNPNFGSQIQKLDTSKTYIVFCRTGSRALAASREISDIGLKNVYSKEGIISWQSNGFEIVK